MRVAWALAALLSAGPFYAIAEEETPVVALPAVVQGHLPAGTLVQIELLQPLSSQKNKRGDKFAIALAHPITSADGVLIPAGVRGLGEVVSAARVGIGGQPGELVLAARYIEYDGRQIPLRALKLGGAGHDDTQGTNICKAILPYCPTFATNLELVPGALAEAKLAADISLPVIAPVPVPDINPTETQ